MVCGHQTRSQDVDLVVSANNVSMPEILLKKYLKPWSREELDVRVFQGVAVEDLLEGECFVEKPLTWSPLPVCSPFSSDARTDACFVRSVFWHSTVDAFLPYALLALHRAHRLRPPILTCRGLHPVQGGG